MSAGSGRSFPDHWLRHGCVQMCLCAVAAALACIHLNRAGMTRCSPFVLSLSPTSSQAKPLVLHPLRPCRPQYVAPKLINRARSYAAHCDGKLAQDRAAQQFVSAASLQLGADARCDKRPASSSVPVWRVGARGGSGAHGAGC